MDIGVEPGRVGCANLRTITKKIIRRSVREMPVLTLQTRDQRKDALSNDMGRVTLNNYTGYILERGAYYLRVVL